MAKRKATITSDDDTPESSQASKRARTADSDEEVVEVHATPQKRERKPTINGKQKAKVHSDEEEEEEEDLHHDDERNEEDEKKFEDDHGEAIRRKLEQRRNTIGVSGSMSIDGHLTYTYCSRESLSMAS
jgi:hypothetical protein